MIPGAAPTLKGREVEAALDHLGTADLSADLRDIFMSQTFGSPARSLTSGVLMVKIARPRFSLPEKASEIWDSKTIQPSRIAILSREILY